MPFAVEQNGRTKTKTRMSSNPGTVPKAFCLVALSPCLGCIDHPTILTLRYLPAVFIERRVQIIDEKNLQTCALFRELGTGRKMGQIQSTLCGPLEMAFLISIMHDRIFRYSWKR